MTDTEDPQAILDSLQPLFREARRKGLWFRSGYQALLFSPDELEAKHKAGKFIWGPVNWTLEDPKDELDRLRLQARAATERALDFAEKLSEAANGS